MNKEAKRNRGKIRNRGAELIFFLGKTPGTGGGEGSLLISSAHVLTPKQGGEVR